MQQKSKKKYAQIFKESMKKAKEKRLKGQPFKLPFTPSTSSFNFNVLKQLFNPQVQLSIIEPFINGFKTIRTSKDKPITATGQIPHPQKQTTKYFIDKADPDSNSMNQFFTWHKNRQKYRPIPSNFQQTQKHLTQSTQGIHFLTKKNINALKDAMKNHDWAGGWHRAMSSNVDQLFKRNQELLGTSLGVLGGGAGAYLLASILSQNKGYRLPSALIGAAVGGVTGNLISKKLT